MRLCLPSECSGHDGLWLPPTTLLYSPIAQVAADNDDLRSRPGWRHNYFDVKSIAARTPNVRGGP